MSENLEPVMLDLVEWVAKTPRPYSEVLHAWQTSCPRLTIFEDVTDLGLLNLYHDAAGRTVIGASPAGHSYLKKKGRMAH